METWFARITAPFSGHRGAGVSVQCVWGLEGGFRCQRSSPTGAWATTASRVRATAGRHPRAWGQAAGVQNPALPLPCLSLEVCGIFLFLYLSVKYTSVFSYEAFICVSDTLLKMCI